MTSMPSIESSDAAPPYIANNSENTRGISPVTPSTLGSVTEATEHQSGKPPPFTFSPRTLSITPDSFYIQCESANAASYPLYQLTRNLGSNPTTTGIVQINPNKVFDSNQLRTNYLTKDLLYKIYKQLDSARTGDEGIAISAQHRHLLQGIVLTHSSGRFSIGGDSSFEARSRAKELLFSGTPQKSKSGLEWRDLADTVVAVELVTPTSGEVMVEERLQIFVELEKQVMDLLVAVWVARMFSVKNREAGETGKLIKQGRQLDEGRLKKRFNNAKEYLGIGYGVKPGPRARGSFF